MDMTVPDLTVGSDAPFVVSLPVTRLDDKLRVTASPALHADLKQLLGPSCIAS
jgi:hypothetical protein